VFCAGETVSRSTPQSIPNAKEKHLKQRILSAALSLGLIGAMLPVAAKANDERGEGHKIKHVLLISVDGLHALDVANYVAAHPGSALAELSRHGITYSNARTPANSDSFPGLLALVTGGSPISHGLFYDVSYDRTFFDPTNPTCSGQPGINMIFDESIDQYVTGPDGLAVSLNKINPDALPHRLDENGNCVRVFPHNAIRTNTIFEVVKSEGGHTAWADKHPAYDLVNGPSGTGVDDLFTPEVTNVGGLDNTVSVVCTFQNDNLKVQAILNEIHGLTHDGKPGAGVPAVFGMNFQAVSVGQKLVQNNKIGAGGVPCPIDAVPPLNGLPGGYTDGSGTPTDVLAYGLRKTDEALGSMIQALKNRGIYDSTLFIVSAKHGQSPINPTKVNKPRHFADLVATLPDAATNAAGIAIAAAAA
jgi:Type I phosphodiesterase / nucleotide pyrophosphatase